MTLALALSFVAVQAQNPAALSACKNATGGTEITYDDTKSCTKGLAGNTKVGFHGGITLASDLKAQWQKVVNWDAATAVNGIAVPGSSNKKFKMTIKNPSTYYGLATGDVIAQYCFVLNQGPKDAANPWAVKGDDTKADGTCDGDFFYTIPATGLPACLIGTNDLKLDVQATLSPNPMEQSTTLSINNTTNETFSVDVTSVTGQVVRTITNVTDNTTIEKGNLNAGLYFVVIRNAAGKFSTQKLIIQ